MPVTLDRSFLESTFLRYLEQTGERDLHMRVRNNGMLRDVFVDYLTRLIEHQAEPGALGTRAEAVTLLRQTLQREGAPWLVFFKMAMRRLRAFTSPPKTGEDLAHTQCAVCQEPHAGCGEEDWVRFAECDHCVHLNCFVASRMRAMSYLAACPYCRAPCSLLSSRDLFLTMRKASRVI